MTDWKPGDIAAFTDVYGREGVALSDDIGWSFVYKVGMGRRWWDHGSAAGSRITFRRLVVLDPKSDEDVERLAAAMQSSPVRYSAAELRILARDILANLVADPEPVEPTGLGAVVEDEFGRVWCRADYSDEPWLWLCHEVAVWHSWAVIPGPTALSHGYGCDCEECGDE